jgi:hypothetical protein
MLLLAEDGIDITTIGNVVLTANKFVIDTVEPIELNSYDIILSSTGSIVLDAGTTFGLVAQDAITIDANAGMTVSVTGGDLLLDVEDCFVVDATDCITLTSGTTVVINSADTQINTVVFGVTSSSTGSINTNGLFTINANVGMDTIVTGVYDVQTTGDITLDSSTGDINIGSDANNGAINIGNNSTRTITIGEASSTIDVLGNSLTLGNTGATIEALGNTTVYGNFTVFGDSVEINAAEVTVDDNNIVLNGISSPTDTNANGGGITLKGNTDKTIIYDKDCPNVGTTGSWSFNQNINIDDTLGYYIDCGLALDQTRLALDATGDDDGIYFNGPSSISAPVAKDLRMTAVIDGSRSGIEIQQYDGSTWKRIWRVRGKV